VIEIDQPLEALVRDRLAEGWTPEQISGWLKGENERRLRAVGCGTNLRFHLSRFAPPKGLSSCGADLPFEAFYFIPLNPLFRLSMNGVPHRP
jgi:hypothetical protein